MNNNKLYLLLAIFLALFILPFSVTALTYDYSSDNGSWFEYESSILSTSYFADDLTQSTYNRDFETSFDLEQYVASEGWITTADGVKDKVSSSSTYSSDGLQSLKFEIDILDRTSDLYIMSAEEIVSDANVSFDLKLVNSGDSYSDSFEWGYVTDSNTFTSMGSIAIEDNSFDWNSKSFVVPSGNYRVAFKFDKGASGGTGTAYFYIDTITSSGAKQESSLSVGNNLTDNYGLRGTNYTFTSDYETGTGASILGADCNLTIGTTDYEMTYNSDTGLYEYSTALVSDGVYGVEQVCASDDFTEKTENYEIEIVSPASNILTIEDLVNVSSVDISDFSNNINFDLSDDDESFEWSIYAQEDNYEVNFYWSNENLDSKQYYVYTSDDGENWTFNDSLTYGEAPDYNSCLQKIRVGDEYEYYFNDEISEAGTKQYYRLAYRNVGKYWNTIGNSLDWVNVNDPQLYEDTDEQNWDLFSDSNYTEIDSYTKEKYPDLTSSDIETGFEFQFTAYASSATNIQVGYEAEDGTSENSSAYIDEEKRRFSIPINPTSERAILKITSDTTQDDRIYITDYALIPKSYFTDRLQIFDLDNSELDAINIGGTSKQYLREGLPFKFDTSAFDINGNLETLRIEALFNNTSIKTYEFDLDEGADQHYNWNEILSGVIDLNGTYNNPADLREALLKATIIDKGGNEVAEQTKEFNILQYPFFANDLELQLFSVGNKVGDNPTFNFDFGQEDPDRFLGMEIFIYDDEHSRTNPNYEDVIYSDELNCGFDCSKTLKIDDWVWEDNSLYRVDVMILVNTENKDYSNDLTYKTFSFKPSYRELDTARILQVYEREDFIYRNDEDIPLVLQLRDVPYRDLSKDYSVYLTLDICSSDSGACDTNGTTKFNPIKHIYNEVSGHNYYYFDNLFYTDDGELLPDGNYIRFKAVLDEKVDTHQLELNPTLTAKCGTYGSDFLHGIFTFDLIEVYEAGVRSVFGCQVDSEAIVEVGDAQEQRIDINASHDVIGGQNQSVLCFNVDSENNYVNSLEQEILCYSLFNKSEQSIDNFTIHVANENSDFSKEDGYEGQYLSFEIPSEHIIFNDPLLLKATLKREYQADSIDTVGELLEKWTGTLYSGVGQPSIDFSQDALEQAGLITNYGFDLNLNRDIDPNYVNGLFAFKIKGLKVLNHYDYLRTYPQLETLDSKLFTRWALRNGVNLPEKETTIEVYSSVGKPIIKQKVLSNLVIYKEPSTTTIEQDALEDSNLTKNVVPTTLSFAVIQDMLSNNETQIDRAYLPLTFTYVVPDNRGVQDWINNVLFGTDSQGKPAGLLTNPINFGLNNWFWFVIAVISILIFAKIVSLFKGNGGTTNINLPENRSG